jgi:hypothetical protein
MTGVPRLKRSRVDMRNGSPENNNAAVGVRPDGGVADTFYFS